MSVSIDFHFQSEILEKSLHAASDAASLSDVSPLTSRGTAPSASLIEQLQSLLKQREGELSNAQVLVIYPENWWGIKILLFGRCACGI